MSGWWLSPTPLKNMVSSVGMMKFPMYIPIEITIYNWLVVLAILKNMNQWEG